MHACPASHEFQCTFRLSTAKLRSMRPFFESFPDKRATTAMRWLIDDPRVIEIMHERVANMTVRRPVT